MHDRNLLALTAFNFVPRNSVFITVSDLPRANHANVNAHRVVGFEPKDEFERYWRRAA